jgi:hypothetical protein
MEEQQRIFGIRAAAVLETVLFLVAALLLDYFFFDADRFWHTQPHPFWIIVALVAAQYGTAEGLFAVAASTLALLFGNMPEQAFEQDTYSYLYDIAINPVMWVVAAVALGELRVRHIRERQRLREELRLAREREEKIAESYEWVRELKQKLELRIAGQFRSSVDTYRAAKSMEKLDPQDVLHGVSELVKAVMNPKKFSVFLREQDGISTAIVSGWEDGDDRLPRQYNSNHRLFQEVIGNRQTLCVANDEQERILNSEGVLVGPLLDTTTNEVVGMLKIEDLGFAELNLSSIETFRAICEWIGMAFVNAGKYQVAKEESVINPDHNLMTRGYFKRYTDYIGALAKRLGFDVSMLVIKLVDAEKLDSAVAQKAARELARVVDGILRTVDLAFDYQAEAGEFSIVLPATDRKGARVVQEKIEKDLARTKAMGKVRFTFMVHSIHEK